MHQISIQEAPALTAIIGDVLRGEEIVITDHNQPVAKVIPFGTTQKRRGLVGSAPDLIKYISDDFDETPEDFKDYR